VGGMGDPRDLDRERKKNEIDTRARAREAPPASLEVITTPEAPRPGFSSGVSVLASKRAEATTQNGQPTSAILAAILERMAAAHPEWSQAEREREAMSEYQGTLAKRSVP